MCSCHSSVVIKSKKSPHDLEPHGQRSITPVNLGLEEKRSTAFFDEVVVTSDIIRNAKCLDFPSQQHYINNKIYSE